MARSFRRHPEMSIRVLRPAARLGFCICICTHTNCVWISLCLCRKLPNLCLPPCGEHSVFYQLKSSQTHKLLTARLCVQLTQHRGTTGAAGWRWSSSPLWGTQADLHTIPHRISALTPDTSQNPNNYSKYFIRYSSKIYNSWVFTVFKITLN